MRQDGRAPRRIGQQDEQRAETAQPTLPGRAAGSARAISSRLHGGDRVCVAATGMDDPHGAGGAGHVPAVYLRR